MSNVRDITRRKEMTREMEHYRYHLEEQIQARTADLQAEIAERTLAQAALQRCQANLAETQRIAHLGSWEVDLATDEVWLSDEMVRIFGFKPEVRPITRADIWNAIHPDDRSAVQAEMTLAMQPDRVYNTRYRIVLPDGDTRAVYIQGEVVRDAAGQPTHIRGMVQDITEQERVKDALGQRVSELSNLQALSAVVSLSLPWEEVAQIYLQRIVTLADLDMAQVFLLMEDRLDLAGVHARKGVQVIPQTECVVGECLCGLAVTERRPLYAGDAQSDARCTREECRAGVLHSLLASPLRSGDAVFGVLTLGARARDAFAGKLAFLETAVDQIAVRLQNALLHREIRERAAGLAEIVAERTRELQTERDRMQAILETVGESVIVTDLDGLVLFSNPATGALTGFSRDETLGQPIWRGWSAQAFKDAWPQAQKALCGGQPWQGEVTGCRKDGAPYVAALTGTPLYEERVATLATGGVWVQRDITAVKEVGRLRDQFVSNVSHELRTPISIIALSCDNLDAFYDRLGEGQRRQMLQDIHTQARVLNDLVEDILTLSQIDSGRVPRRTDRIDLAHLVREEVERQQPRAEGRSQRLSVSAGAPIFVPCNEVQLRRVMRNLLDNAIKYTPSGGWILCTCEIRAAWQAAAPEEGPPSTGSWAVMEVADGGIGIAAEDTRYLFERFHRVNGESDIPGTGLGLSIARELVVLHGGRITVASALGQGSIFTVYLPLGQQASGDGGQASGDRRQESGVRGQESGGQRETWCVMRDTVIR